MKTFVPVIILTLLTSTHLQAGRVKDIVVNHPDQWQAIVETGSYAKILQFLKDAYAEHLADPDDEALQYAYLGTLDRAPLDKQIPLNLDFTLNQTELTLRQIGAHAIYQAVLKGASLEGATRDRLITKLKKDLAGIDTVSRESFDFARYAVYTLVLLGDDAGLDGYLTDTAEVRNISLKDRWQSDTEPARFDELSKEYADRAAQKGSQNNEREKVYSALYQDAKNRRAQGNEVKPLQPLVDLDKLKKF